MRPFAQIDVFTATPYKGNPVAVVLEADDLSSEEMQAFAHWTNLSETTFVLSPTRPDADYRVRIFTPGVELPFAGHPTIGTCHAWLEAGGKPHNHEVIVQECGVGLVSLRRKDGRIAFAAPPRIRSGPPTDEELAEACRILGIGVNDVVDAEWADNGASWIAVMLGSAQAVLDLNPDFGASDAYDIGVVGLQKVGVVAASDGDCAIEVRAFFRAGGPGTEDPVTGSLNAAVAQWLLSNGTLKSPYIAAQGTVLGRAGRVYIEEAGKQIWVGGDAVTCVSGTVEI